MWHPLKVALADAFMRLAAVSRKYGAICRSTITRNIDGSEYLNIYFDQLMTKFVICFLEPLSDFSINAIQSMRGTPSVSTASASETSGSSTVTASVAEETETHTKSIATMTSDQRQDKSISPMKVIMRKETGFQFRRFEETKISASIGGISPIKSSLSFDDAVIRKSLHHQIDLTGTTVLNNDKMKSSSTNIRSKDSVYSILFVLNPPENPCCCTSKVDPRLTTRV